MQVKMSKLSKLGKKIKFMIVICLIVITFSICFIFYLTITKYKIVQVDWAQSTLVFRDLNCYSAKIISNSSDQYIFFTASNDSNNLNLYYLKNNGSSWSQPILINLNISISSSFDCFYDQARKTFHIFVCHENESEFAIYHAYGLLNELNNATQITKYPNQYNDSRKYGIGAHHPNAFVDKNGNINLFYTWITGITENINYIEWMKFDGVNWSFIEGIGVGNSPVALQTQNGDINVYSNLWTLSNKPQYCVNELIFDGTNWTYNEIITSARDCNVDPFVFQDLNGTMYLFYNHKEYGTGTKTNLLIQTKRLNQDWSSFKVIVEGQTEYGIRSPSAIKSDAKTIKLCYINESKIYFIEGIIKE